MARVMKAATKKLRVGASMTTNDKDEAVLNRLNGHPMRAGELRHGMTSGSFGRVIRRLINKGKVREVAQGYYEKAVTA
jgi:hypothetical protein